MSEKIRGNGVSLLLRRRHLAHPRQSVCQRNTYSVTSMSKQYLLSPHKRDHDGTASSRSFLEEERLGGRSATIYPSPLSLLAISLLTFVLQPGYLSRREGVYHQICSSWGPARLSACRTSHYRRLFTCQQCPLYLEL